MPSNLLTLFEQLAEKAGIALDDARLTEFFKRPELLVTVPDEISATLNKTLISLEDAKNNHPIIKSHYFAEVMANVDRALQKVYQKLQLDDEIVAELSKETSSTKRIALLGDKLDEVIAEKTKAAGKGDSAASAALQKQIDDLNAALRAEKDARKTDKSSYETEMLNYKIENSLSGKIGGLKTIYDTLPADVRATTIKTLLNKEFQDSDVKLVIDENGGLKLQKKDGSNYYDENNRQVSADEFIQRTLAKNKILSQSAPPAGGNGGGGEPGGLPPKKVEGGGKATVDMTSLFDESLKAFDNPNPVSIATGN